MPLLIGIHGKARSGKDTMGEFLFNHHNFTSIPFAGPMKQAATHLFGEDPFVFYNQEGKASLNEYWQMTRRRMLQDLGEGLCQTFGADFWIRRWFIDYQAIGPFDNVVVTDVRKEEEAEFLRTLGGVIVHLHRTGAGLEGEEGKHKTEQGIPVHPNDVVINNNGTLRDLAIRTAALVRVLKEKGHAGR